MATFMIGPQDCDTAANAWDECGDEDMASPVDGNSNQEMGEDTPISNAGFLIGPEDSDIADIAQNEFGYLDLIQLTDENFSQEMKNLNEDTPVFIENEFSIKPEFLTAILERSIPIVSNNQLSSATDQQREDIGPEEAYSRPKKRGMLVNTSTVEADGESSLKRSNTERTTRPARPPPARLLSEQPKTRMERIQSAVKKVFTSKIDLKSSRTVDLNEPLGTDATDSNTTAICTDPGTTDSDNVIAIQPINPPSKNGPATISKNDSEVTVRCDIRSSHYASISNKPEEEIAHSIITASCTAEITRKATETNKLITFKLNFGMSSTSKDERMKMANTGILAKGFFNDAGEIYFFPGTDPKIPDYPDGWRKIVSPNAPKTPNHVIKKTDSSEHNAQLGLSYPSPDAKIGYSRAKHITTESNDFTTRTGETGWSFFYTALENDEWKKHFSTTKRALGRIKKVKDIAELAKSHIPFKAEGAFEGPKDCNETITCTLLFLATFKLLRTNGRLTGRCYSLTLKQSMQIELDMSEVQASTE